MHVEYCSPRIFYKCIKYELSKALFFLPAVIEAGELIWRYFKFELLHENSTMLKIDFRHVYSDQEKSFNEKAGVKKSR